MEVEKMKLERGGAPGSEMGGREGSVLKEQLLGAKDALDEAKTLLSLAVEDLAYYGRKNTARLLRTLLPLSVAFSYLVSACGGGEQTSVAPTPIHGDTGPTPTLVSPEVTAVAPTATIAPSETATPVATAEPSATARPTETVEPTEIPAAELARENGLEGYYHEGEAYLFTEENGERYLADSYGNKFLKYDGGKWGPTSMEERFGSHAKEDADYEVREYESSDGSKSYGIPAFFTGAYRTEKITVNGVETEVIRMVYVTRNEAGKLVVFENLDGGFLGTANTVKIEFVQYGIRFADAQGRVFDYAPVDYLLGYNLKFEDLLKALTDRDIDLRELPVELRLNVSSDADLAKGRELFPGIVCDPSDESYNGGAKCDAVAFRQIAEKEEFPFFGGVMPDGQGMKDARDTGTEQIKTYNLEATFRLNVEDIGGPEGVRQLKEELGAQ